VNKQFKCNVTTKTTFSLLVMFLCIVIGVFGYTKPAHGGIRLEAENVEDFTINSITKIKNRKNVRITIRVCENLDQFAGRIGANLYEGLKDKRVTYVLNHEEALSLIQNRDESIVDIVNNNANIPAQYKQYIIDYYNLITMNNPNADFSVFKENVRRLLFIDTIPADIFTNLIGEASGAFLPTAHAVLIKGEAKSIRTIYHELSHLHNGLYLDEMTCSLRYDDFNTFGNKIDEGLTDQFMVESLGIDDNVYSTERTFVTHLYSILGREQVINNFLYGDIYDLTAQLQEATKLDEETINNLIIQVDDSPESAIRQLDFFLDVVIKKMGKNLLKLQTNLK